MNGDKGIVKKYFNTKNAKLVSTETDGSRECILFEIISTLFTLIFHFISFRMSLTEKRVQSDGDGVRHSV